MTHHQRVKISAFRFGQEQKGTHCQLLNDPYRVHNLYYRLVAKMSMNKSYK